MEYQREIERLTGVNKQLEQNSKAIEKKCSEVEQLAKIAIKPKKNSNELEDATKTTQIETAKFATISIHDEETEKTLPKHRPPKSKSPKNKKKKPETAQSKLVNITHEKVPTKERPPVVNTSDDEKESQSSSRAKPKSRFLLGYRPGDSLDRLDEAEKKRGAKVQENSSDDENMIISRREYEVESKDRAERILKKQQEKEIKKRQSHAASTLHEIAKLRADIDDVSSSFRGVDLEERERESIARKKQLMDEVETKLEASNLKSYFHQKRKEARDAQYEKNKLKSESSSDKEEKIAHKVLNKRKQDLNRMKQNLKFKHQTKQKIAHRALHQFEDEDEESRLHGETPSPYTIEPKNITGKFGYSLETVHKHSHNLHKTADNRPSRQHLPPSSQRRRQLRDYLDTSEEEDRYSTPDLLQMTQSRNMNIQTFGSSGQVPEYSRSSNPFHQHNGKAFDTGRLDQMTEEQLKAIKELVDERIQEKKIILHQQGLSRDSYAGSRQSHNQEDEIIESLNDDFYDGKFLNLIFEMAGK